MSNFLFYRSGGAVRRLASTVGTLRSSFAGSALPTTAPYVSPYAELFDTMRNNGPTTLGLTQDYIDFVRQGDKKLDCGIPESALRFTTTSYGRTLVAPGVHSNEHRVILKLNLKYLPLNTTGMEILREIVGNRLNDERSELRLTSNQFGSRIENKRHLVSMLDRIILSCQKLGASLEEGNEPSKAVEEGEQRSEAVGEGEQPSEVVEDEEKTAESTVPKDTKSV